MKDYARSFYNGKEWRKVSALYMGSINYICERCGGVAEICHHKNYITPKNITDPNITLNLDNLEGLCIDCHNKEHKRKYGRNTNRTIFDSNGNIVGVKESQEIQDYKQAVKAIDSMKLKG